jgi:hypothetical protein
MMRPYSQGQLDAAVRRGQAQMAAAPERRTDGEIEFRRSIPEELYYNAILGHKVDPQDQEYWSDMERREPWIVHKQKGKIRVGGCVGGASMGRPRNRFGRLASRTVYRDGRRFEVVFGDSDGHGQNGQNGGGRVQGSVRRGNLVDPRRKAVGVGGEG